MLSTTFPISCGPQDDTGSESEEEEEVSTEFVSLTQRQMEVIGLRLTRFEQRNIEVRIPVTGRLELAPQDRADVSPMIGGIVKEIRVFEGDAVQKGSILAVLEHPDLMQLQQDHLADLSTLEYLEKEHDRQKTLSDEKVGSEKMFEKAEAEYLTKKSHRAESSVTGSKQPGGQPKSDADSFPRFGRIFASLGFDRLVRVVLDSCALS